jgi:hypothetical protein
LLLFFSPVVCPWQEGDWGCVLIVFAWPLSAVRGSLASGAGSQCGRSHVGFLATKVIIISKTLQHYAVFFATEPWLARF